MLPNEEGWANASLFSLQSPWPFIMEPSMILYVHYSTLMCEVCGCATSNGRGKNAQKVRRFSHNLGFSIKPNAVQPAALGLS